MKAWRCVDDRLWRRLKRLSDDMAESAPEHPDTR